MALEVFDLYSDIQGFFELCSWQYPLSLALKFELIRVTAVVPGTGMSGAERPLAVSCHFIADIFPLGRGPSSCVGG